MSRTQRFFRYIWRVNGVAILIAASAIVFMAGWVLVSELGWKSERQRVADAAPPVANADPSERLYLGAVSEVKGTDILLGRLLAPGQGKGFSSGGYGGETRNLLFIDGHSKATRWLLPDSRHVLTRQIDITSTDGPSRGVRTIAMAVLAKPVSADTEAVDGTLLLLDPSGKQVRTISDGVREIDHAGLNTEGRIVVLFERRRQYVLATFDGNSLDKNGEQELSVAQLP